MPSKTHPKVPKVSNELPKSSRFSPSHIYIYIYIYIPNGGTRGQEMV